MSNYNQILGAVQEQAAQEKQAALDLQSLYFAMGQNESAAAIAEAQGTTSFNGKTETVESAKVRLQAELEAQNKKRELAAHINYNDLSFALGAESERIGAERSQLASQIQEAASVSIFDNPLQALRNAFEIPWDQQNLDAMTQQQKVIDERLNRAHVQLTQFSDTTDKLKESITQKAIDSITQGLANDQRAKELRAHNKALMNDAQGITAVSQMNHQQLMTLKAGYDIVATEENRQYQREYRNALLEERNARREAKETAEQTILEDVRFTKEAMAESGMLNKDGNYRFTDAEIRRGLERKDPFFSNFRDRGVIIRAQGRASHGESPTERVASWQITGFSGQGDAQDNLMRLNLAALDATKDVKDKTQRAEAAQKIIETKLNELQKNVSSGDKTNPLHLPAYEYIGMTKVLTSNPAYALVKDIVEDKTLGKQATDVNVIYGKLLSGIAAKQITEAQATRFLVDLGVSGRSYVASTAKVFQLTNWDQSRVGVRLQPGSAVGDTMIAAAPIITVGGVLTGAGAPMSVGVGAASAFVGNMLSKQSIPVNLLDESEVRMAISKGIASKMITPAPESNDRASK